MVLMAKALELGVVAEGVETINQLAFLEAQGRDQGAGLLPEPPCRGEGRSRRGGRRDCDDGSPRRLARNGTA